MVRSSSFRKKRSRKLDSEKFCGFSNWAGVSRFILEESKPLLTVSGKMRGINIFVEEKINV